MATSGSGPPVQSKPPGHFRLGNRRGNEGGPIFSDRWEENGPIN
jgi:hypothetical protein